MGEPMVLVATMVNRAPDGQQATVWSVLGAYPGGAFVVEEAGSWEECGTNTAARRIIERLAYGHGGSVAWATERVVHILRPGLKCAAWGIADPYLCGAKHVPGGPTAGDSYVYYDAVPTALNLETCPECIAALATEGGG